MRSTHWTARVDDASTDASAPRGHAPATMHLTPLQSRLAASLIASCLLVLLYLSLFAPHLALAAELGSEEDRAAFPPVVFENELSAADELLDDPRIGGRDAVPEEERGGGVAYEPEFAAFDRSILGRAPAGVTELVNNIPVNLDVVPGSTQYFMLDRSALVSRAEADQDARLELRGERSTSSGGHEADDTIAWGVGSDDGDDDDGGAAAGWGGDVGRLGRRQSSTLVYLSANTCMQPQGGPGTGTSSATPP
ncbi:MAG: MID1 family protein, partial [Thaumarchaeota archaeon]|nr:MID1 family protein [Nitrososphaerota archaeon]